MQERTKLPSGGMVVVLGVLLLAAMVHLWRFSRPYEEQKKVKRWTRPRLPVHPPDPLMTPDRPEYVQTMKSVEEIRAYFADSLNHPARIGPGSRAYEDALRRLQQYDLAMLHPLELIVLDEDEAPFVRGAILDVLARHAEEAIRQLLAGLLADPQEHEYVRSKALDHLNRYEGEANFRVLREVYDLEPEFPDRYRLLLAMARTKSVKAVAVLLGALETDQELEVRCAAAQGLEEFIRRPEVWERLERIARGGDAIPVRRNAIGALASRSGPEVDHLLRALANSPSEPEEIRRIARSWQEQRKR